LRNSLSRKAFCVPPEGTEQTAKSSGNRGVAPQGGAESGALSSDFAPGGAPLTVTDPDLAAVVSAWPTLPDATRRQVVAMIRVAIVGRPPKRKQPGSE
jgi:hypothetical protein